MLKYRRLSLEELEELREEFIQFLAANGIDGPKWQEIQNNNEDEMYHFIDAFSNVVMEKSLQNIAYIEHKTPTDYKIFFYDKEGASFYGLKSNSINLSNIDGLDVEDGLSSKDLTLLSASKQYTKTREEELFEMLQKGCEITTHKTFLLLKQLAKK